MKPVFDIYPMNGFSDESTLIISWPTGILYSAQCGGISCLHPEYEGFIKILSIRDFYDCKYGCYDIHNSHDLRLKLAQDLDLFLRDQTQTWIFKLAFDFECLDSLKEGWWPVLLNGKLDSFDDYIFRNHKAILCAGNCD